jgi:hypothetical protein
MLQFEEYNLGRKALGRKAQQNGHKANGIDTIVKSFLHHDYQGRVIRMETFSKVSTVTRGAADCSDHLSWSSIGVVCMQPHVRRALTARDRSPDSASVRVFPSTSFTLVVLESGSPAR